MVFRLNLLVAVLLIGTATANTLLRGNEIVQNVPTQTVVTSNTVISSNSCGCCGVDTCKCCSKEPAFQRPKIVENLNVSMAPPPCGTCNGACPCESGKTVPVRTSGMTVVTMNDAMQKQCECCGQSVCACCAQKPAPVVIKTQCDCCGSTKCTCCEANLNDIVTHNDTHHTVDVSHPIEVTKFSTNPCECQGKANCGCGTVLSDPKTPEDHANEKKHEPLVVPCDCNAKDIHPSCGCPGNEGMGDLGMTGSSATGGVEMKTVTTVQNTPCGCCGVETCKCCAKKVEYQKPKMVQSLTVKLSDCACVGLPSCACNTKMPVDIETATAPRKNSVDEKTLEKLEDIAVGKKEDAEKAVEEKRSEKKEKPVEEVNKRKGKNVDKKENTKETETMPKKDLKKELEEMEKKFWATKHKKQK